MKRKTIYSEANFLISEGKGEKTHTITHHITTCFLYVNDTMKTTLDDETVEEGYKYQ